MCELLSSSILSIQSMLRKVLAGSHKQDKSKESHQTVSHYVRQCLIMFVCLYLYLYIFICELLSHFNDHTFVNN